ncbi:hypothetical protein LLT3_07655 [Lactococcus cremoris subsp. cremoris TIFN3]|uniref:Uncharacterized protein n=1 Tax=Lactococcus cremoris subsp. cremoris TIFN3 TaxID=1234873 RepID=T0WMA8_LACLC|nr:hypothetical protein LLT3_07655 [Lactococcus cremoris subsp. cremoris TIFN3]
MVRGHPPQVADGQVGLGLRLQAQHKPMRSVFLINRLI